MLITRLLPTIGIIGLVASLSACGAASPETTGVAVSEEPVLAVAGDRFQVEDIPVALSRIHPEAENILPPGVCLRPRFVHHDGLASPGGGAAHE